MNTGKTRFKKGIIPWNKGKTGVYSKEVIEKIRNCYLNGLFFSMLPIGTWENDQKNDLSGQRLVGVI